MLICATIESRGTVGLSVNHLRSLEPRLLAGVPHEEQRALGALVALGDRLGDLQQRHGARPVVVGAVHDRVEPRGPQLPHAVHQRLDPRRLLGVRLSRRVVRAAGPHDGVVRPERVVVHRGHDADGVVVGAERHVLAAERGIRSLHHRHHVGRPEVALVEGHLALDRRTGVSRLELVQRLAEQLGHAGGRQDEQARLGHPGRDGQVLLHHQARRPEHLLERRDEGIYPGHRDAGDQPQPRRRTQVGGAEVVARRAAVIDHDLPLELLAGRQRGAVGRAADVDQRRPVDGAGGDFELRLIGVVVLPQHQLARPGPQGRLGGIHRVAGERDFLKEGAAVARGPEAQPLDLARDVGVPLRVAGRARPPALHRVVGEDRDPLPQLG